MEQQQSRRRSDMVARYGLAMIKRLILALALLAWIAPAHAFWPGERAREAAERARIAAAASYARDIDLIDGPVACTLEEGAPRRGGGEPRATRLLDVADQDLILLVAHGFEVRPAGGTRTHASIRALFADVIALAQARPGDAAICTVRWKSHAGLAAPENASLGQALSALRTLALRADQRIALVGYSAGGNLVKQAVAEEIARRPSAPARLAAATLGTPHAGAPLAEAGAMLGRAGAVIYGLAALARDDQVGLDWAHRALADIDALETAPGYRELLPGAPALAALNDRFGDALPAIDYLNVWSDADEAAPPESTRWSTRHDLLVPGVSHLEIVQVPQGSPAEHAFIRLFGG